MIVMFNASARPGQSQASDLHLCIRQRPTPTVWDSATGPIWRTIFSWLAQLEHRPEHRPEQRAVVAVGAACSILRRAVLSGTPTSWANALTVSALAQPMDLLGPTTPKETALLPETSPRCRHC